MNKDKVKLSIALVSATYPRRLSSSKSLPSPVIGKKPSSKPIINNCLNSNLLQHEYSSLKLLHHYIHHFHFQVQFHLKIF